MIEKINWSALIIIFLFQAVGYAQDGIIVSSGHRT